MKNEDVKVETVTLQNQTDKEKFENNEELQIMSMRMRKMQDDVLNRYFSNSDVIKLNYLEHIRAHSSEINSKEEFKEFLLNEKKKMKDVDRKFTHIERIEYRMLNKVYRDVIDGEGEEFSFDRDLLYQYDDKEITIPPIEFGKLS
jgi:hypothetical protein